MLLNNYNICQLTIKKNIKNYQLIKLSMNKNSKQF